MDFRRGSVAGGPAKQEWKELENNRGAFSRENSKPDKEQILRKAEETGLKEEELGQVQGRGCSMNWIKDYLLINNCLDINVIA